MSETKHISKTFSKYFDVNDTYVRVNVLMLRNFGAVIPL